MNDHDKHHPGHHHPDSDRRGAGAVATGSPVWNGSYTTLNVGQSQSMATPNANMAMLLNNLGNSATTAQLTSGGAPPVPVQVPPGQNAPVVYINNWLQNALSVSDQSGSSIGAQAAAYMMPGITPTSLVYGTSLAMAPNAYAQGIGAGTFMNLTLNSIGSNALTTFVVMGGVTPGVNPTTYALVISVNAAANTGPASGSTFNTTYVQPTGIAPAYATTTQGSYIFQFNWGSGVIWVANVSGSTTQNGSVILTGL